MYMLVSKILNIDLMFKVYYNYIMRLNKTCSCLFQKIFSDLSINCSKVTVLLEYII